MSCVRFETEGLLALERGDALEPHFDACPDCAGAKGKYEWLRVGLAAAGEGTEAPPGFEARVWARIARLEAPRRSRLWAGVAAAFAAGIAVFVVPHWFLEPEAPGAPSLAMDIVNGAVVVRGKDAQRGNVLRLLATTGTSQYAELRVYRAENLVLSCSDKPPCRREGDRIEVEAPIKAPGRHELVLLLADGPLPAPQGRFDADMDAAARAGAQILTAAPVEAY